MKKLKVLLIAFAALPLACQKEAPRGQAQTTAASKPAPIASAEAQPVQANTVTFAKKPLAVGAKIEHQASNHIAMTVTAEPAGGKAKTSTVDSNEKNKRTEEVVAVSGDAVTKVRVTYQELDERDKGSPLIGKTITVEFKDGKLAITDDKEKALGKKEADLVSKEYRALGKAEPIYLAMPTRPLSPGEAVHELDKAVEEDMRQGSMEEGLEVSDVGVTFKEKQGDAGLFDVKMTLLVTKLDDPMKLKMDLTGVMKIRIADSFVTSVDLSGPMAISLNPKAKGADTMKVDGKGTVEIHESRSLP
jgi:hypothetical protein